MTLYQAKGLEFPIVFVPSLLDGEWPTREGGGGLSRASCCARPCPTGDIHTDEERRLLYVAMTRAQERLILTTHGGPAAKKEPSRFVGEMLDGAGDEIRRDRSDRATDEPRSTPRDVDALEPIRRRRRPTSIARSPPSGASCRCRPPASAGSRCACGRASSSGSWRRPPRPIPRAPAARDAFAARARRRRAARRRRPPTRRAPQGLDPLTFRTLALDAGAGANLLQVAPLPRDASATRRFDAYDDVPAPVRVQATSTGCRRASEPVAAFTFGSTAHAAFEAFTKERRERARARRAAADPRGPRARVPGATGPRPASATRPPRRATSGASRPCSTTSGTARSAAVGEALARGARLRADARARRRLAAGRHHRLRSTGSTGCRRAASRSSTTRPAGSSARRTSTRASSSRSTRSPAATRWASARPSG